MYNVAWKFAPIMFAFIGSSSALPTKPVPERIRTKSLCEEARAWVTAHPEVRPIDLATLSELPIHYQRALFNSYTAAEQSLLWRQHFARYTSGASRFTERQKAYVDSVGRNIESFIASKPSDREIERFAFSATLMLGRQEAKTVFGRLGFIDPTIIDDIQVGHGFVVNMNYRPINRAGSHSSTSAVSRLVRYSFTTTKHIATFRSVAREACGCHVGGIGDFCDSGTGPKESCKAVAGCGGIGCGWLFLQECNGNCEVSSQQ
ncbi:MAG: bacteriocin fulvocin C-related protein [Gemmatimonadaceae bacterium]